MRQNPEPLAPFVDLFVIGDGEPSLPVVCDFWLRAARVRGCRASDEAGRGSPASVSWAYVPRFYEPDYDADGPLVAIRRLRDDVPEAIEPVRDRRPGRHAAADAADRAVRRDARTTGSRSRSCAAAPGSAASARARSSSGRCAIRTVETIVQAALESYRNTGYDEISLLSLSTSDYPHFEQLVKRMHEVFRPLGVNISLPSLRVNETLQEARGADAGGAHGTA